MPKISPTKSKTPTKRVTKKKIPTKNPPHRPLTYTKETFDVICARVSKGESLRSILREKTMPEHQTFYKWLRTHEDLSTQYTHAKEDRADTYADEIIDIADESVYDKKTDKDGNETVDADVIQRARLRIDARKWIACKLHPRNYGDKKNIELTGKDGGAIKTQTITPVDERISELLETKG